MGTAIKISDKLAESARLTAQVENRSLSGQLEYWATIGKIATENPDLSFDLIHEILVALAEAENGRVKEYQFGS
ncbi:MAG: hypothetical protein GXO69_11520 [Acidobacteria bacterium]|nr:hypothetical protein [Acidobacteriota bacterium]